jgi:hypothetical protein
VEAAGAAAASAAAGAGGTKKGAVKRDGARVRESAAARGARVALMEGAAGGSAVQGGRAEEKRVVFVD